MSYCLLSRVYVLPTLGKLRLADLDARRIESWMRALLAESLSAHTVGLCRALLRRAVEQAQAILTAFEGHRFGPLITLVLGLGLRIGEALGLRWEDIEYAGERPVRLSVRVQLQYVSGEFQLTPPKTSWPPSG